MAFGAWSRAIGFEEFGVRVVQIFTVGFRFAKDSHLMLVDVLVAVTVLMQVFDLVLVVMMVHVFFAFVIGQVLRYVLEIFVSMNDQTGCLFSGAWRHGCRIGA